MAKLSQAVCKVESSQSQGIVLHDRILTDARTDSPKKECFRQLINGGDIDSKRKSKPAIYYKPKDSPNLDILANFIL